MAAAILKIPKICNISAMAAILKNWKILISSQPLDRFWRNLARWCVSTLWTPSANKILQIQQSKMTTAAILKNRKILISSQPIDRFWRNLTCSWVSILCTRLANKIGDFKNERWQRPSWKFEKLQYLCYGYKWTSFDKIWHGDVPRSYRSPQHIKFKAFKNSTWWPIAIWIIKKHGI